MDDEARELEALEHVMSDANAEPIRLSYGLLRYITDNFSDVIGRGGFGIVYKGVLQNGVVAVKKLLNLHALPEKQFLDEITCLEKAKHKNIVRFLGYCSEAQGELFKFNGKNVLGEAQQKLLCFEYVPNGNIKHYLQQDNYKGDDWPLRYQMIRGICQGLHFLHGEHINHLDLKPENVMLDAHMEPKITDFGLSRCFDQGQSKVFTQNIVGTLGYIAPETIDHGEISFKSDMYALGIIIIELLTGTSMKSLKNWDESLDLLDCPRARMCAELARNCTDAKRDNRPTIHEVIHCMDELESTIPVSSTTHQLVTPTAFPGTELLDVYPQELRFLFVPDEGGMSCSLTMTNKTDCFVFCLVASSDSHLVGEYRYPLRPMSSSVVQVDMIPEEEIPSNLVEWEILIFTTPFDNEEIMADQMESADSELAKGMPLEDLIKVVQEVFGGELHRAALTASVIVGSEVLQVHTIDKEETITIDWMDVHPTEPWVLLRAGDTVYIWNWQSKEKLVEYNSPARDVHIYERMSYLDDSVAKFIAREQWAVIGYSDGSITVHTCPTMDQVKKFKAHGHGVSSLAVHPTRPFLLSYSYPKSLKLWDWSRDWSLTTTFVVRSPLSQVKFNPHDTTTFAARGRDGVVEMWPIGRRHPIATAQTQDLHNCSTYFTYTGHRDFTAVIENDNTIRIWDLRREKHVYTLHNSEHDYVLVVCHPTRPILVTASTSGRIEVWDSTTYRLKKAYDNVPDGPKHVGFTGSGRLVIGYRRGIAVLDIDLE